MAIRGAALIILLGTLIPTQAQDFLNFHYWGKELQPVLTVLQQAHLSAWMELSGRCDPAQLPGIPQFNSANISGLSVLKALGEIVSVDPAMRVKQDVAGTIWMRERGVPADILKIRIARVVFKDYGNDDVYSANAALEAVLRVPEVINYAKTHNFAVSPSPTDPGGIAGPAGRLSWPPGSPHMSGSIYNVTVLEALNRIQRSFPGEVLVYWNCPETQHKHEPKRTMNSPFSDCSVSSGDTQSAVFPPGVPNPFCIPRSVLLGLPQWFPAELGPSHQRRTSFWFFTMKKGHGGKMLIVSG